MKVLLELCCSKPLNMARRLKLSMRITPRTVFLLVATSGAVLLFFGTSFIFQVLGVFFLTVAGILAVRRR